PSCINRVMGNADRSQKNLVDTLLSVSRKAGLQVIIPEGIQSGCCGQIFSSKGFGPAYEIMANDIIEKLWDWTDAGKRPVVLDVSSCTYTLAQSAPVLTAENKARLRSLKILDSVSYIHDMLLDRLDIRAQAKKIALH